MKRSLLAGAALLALAAPAATADAAPKKTTTASWWASFTAEQQIDWRWPKTYGTSDCYKRFWSQGSGRERITVKTTRRTRVLVQRSPGSSSPEIRYGTWNPLAIGGDGLRATGRTLRQAVESSGVDAGRCGGEAERFEQDRTDCGARAATYTVTFGLARGRMFPRIDGVPPSFSSCPLHAPGRFTRWFGEPLAELAAARLLGRRAITVSRTMVDSDYDPRRRERIRDGQVTWTLTLTPAR